MAHYIETIENLKPSQFQGKKSYEYSVRSKGLNTVRLGSVGPEGNVRVIGVENTDKVVVIGYSQNEDYDQILSTFKFTNNE